ncbi:MAG: sulfatase [Planctomycetaceae bacterium]|nr:sulfatase [Planctomycetaceae bacterium]
MHRFLDLRSTSVAPRRGLHALPTLCALGAILGIDAATRADDPRPNIVMAIADDWSWPHAGAYGDRVVKTPAFDRVAAEGVLFTHAFCASPSCTPSRGAILTGQAIHRLENGGNLWSLLPERFACYPDLLEASGYVVGLTGKGWGPGTLEGSGRSRNPAGPAFPSFERFLERVPGDKPFCYWFGSQDPHRPYDQGAGLRSGKKPEDVVVPPFLPDTPEVRGDILDYYGAVERFDRAVAAILQQLDARGLAANTIVVVTSDNGMPFPRCKANLYDSGTHMPLAIRWPARVKRVRTVDAFVCLADLAPTFLEAAGQQPPPEMTGRSVLDLLRTGTTQAPRDHVFMERERHANVRRGDLSYPCRAVRTRDFLYIRNLRPDRWPAGDPTLYVAVGPFGDVDPSPSKDLILDRRDDPAFAEAFRMAFAKRPAEELYDLRNDPMQRKNIADDQRHARDKSALRAALDRWMAETADPRVDPADDRWDRYPYVGEPAKK